MPCHAIFFLQNVNLKAIKQFKNEIKINTFSKFYYTKEKSMADFDTFYF